MKPLLLLFFVAALVSRGDFSSNLPVKIHGVESAVRAVMTAERDLRDIPLREVVVAATGRQVMDLQPDKVPADAAARDHITVAAEKLLVFLNAKDSPVRGLRRINEASRHVEEKLLDLLNAGSFICGYPKTGAGESQRSGYPDLRLEHKESGRVYYLEPKLYEASSESSTLRTFYYEPKDMTGKISNDACHLILGIAHDGKDGVWQFTSWRLADLYDFRVRLKAEFQASNKEFYQEELTVSKSK